MDSNTPQSKSKKNGKRKPKGAHSLRRGSETVSLAEGTTVTVRANGPFTIYGTKAKERVSIIGPADETKRYCKFIMHGISEFEISCDKATLWNFESVAKLGPEKLDLTPIEVALPEGPPSLREQMRQFVREEMSQHGLNQGHETWEEANDFGPDEEPEFTSEFEVSEMEDEMPPPPTPEEQEAQTRAQIKEWLEQHPEPDKIAQEAVQDEQEAGSPPEP
ncbi:hypothetical protein [Microviridae sp.]|nr:hypothetical protein [Microviridae sp.]